MNIKKSRVYAVDLFCGAGGLTRGLLDSGIKVVAGYDIDESCRYPYDANNAPATFYKADVADITAEQINSHYKKSSRKVLVGCAPCQPFSKYTQGKDQVRDPKWSLLNNFAKLSVEVEPEVISMENVIELQRHSVYRSFIKILEDAGYEFSAYEVFAPDYGLAQSRTRLLAFASKYGRVVLPKKTHNPQCYPNTKQFLADLPPINHGEASDEDPLHRCSELNSINLRRIQHSTPGGTWRDWPRELVANCHKEKSGHSYPSVYGRFEWDKPAPTITTQFFGFGNGRFGHPEQDRALSLREGAILQGFPRDYKFVAPNQPYIMKNLGRLIGNAVPVNLGKVVGDAIYNHLEKNK